MMNALQEYITSTNPQVWLDSENVNGLDNPQPLDNAGVNVFTNLGSIGNVANAIVDNVNIFPPTFRANGGLNNKPYIDIDPSIGVSKALFIPDNNWIAGVNKFSFLIVASNITIIDSNNYGVVSRDIGTNFGSIVIGAVSTSNDYSTINGQTHLGNVETQFAGDIRFINADRHKRSFLSDIRTFDGQIGSKIISSDNILLKETVNTVTSSNISTLNYPITFGFRGRSNTGNPNNVVISSSNSGSKCKNRLYEFAYWKRTLSQNEVKRLQTYIKLKYNI